MIMAVVDLIHQCVVLVKVLSYVLIKSYRGVGLDVGHVDQLPHVVWKAFHITIVLLEELD